MGSPYKILGVAEGAPLEECKTAYKVLRKKYHPDNGGDTDSFNAVVEAMRMIESGSYVVVPRRSGLRHQSLFIFV